MRDECRSFAGGSPRVVSRSLASSDAISARLALGMHAYDVSRVQIR
jgi:hypothetical protein